MVGSVGGRFTNFDERFRGPEETSDASAKVIVL